MSWERELSRVVAVAMEASERLRAIAVLLRLVQSTLRLQSEQWKMCPACDAAWQPVAETVLEQAPFAPDGQTLCVCGLTYAQHTPLRCGAFQEAP